jgi:type I restriction enzyme R subunit
MQKISAWPRVQASQFLQSRVSSHLLHRHSIRVIRDSSDRYAERHDNIEAIYKKLQDRRDTADVTELLKELHRIVNEAIRAAAPGEDRAQGLTVDLSQIDFEKLRDEFASKARGKHAAIQDIRDVLEKKLADMLARNPLRMDCYKEYQEIIADYNREKDRATVEATFAELVGLTAALDAEQRRVAEEGLSDDELALFDLLFQDRVSKADRERSKTGEQVFAGIASGIAQTDAGVDQKQHDADRGQDLCP